MTFVLYELTIEKCISMKVIKCILKYFSKVGLIEMDRRLCENSTKIVKKIDKRKKRKLMAEESI